MKNRKNINAPQVPRMHQSFPHAVIANDLVYVSGTPGLDQHTGQVVSPDFEAQLRQAFSNIQAILEEAGTDISAIVKTTVFMVAGNDFTKLNQVYQEYFPENAPARSTPQVMPFPGGILVSVECIATLNINQR